MIEQHNASGIFLSSVIRARNSTGENPMRNIVSRALFDRIVDETLITQTMTDRPAERARPAFRIRGAGGGVEAPVRGIVRQRMVQQRMTNIPIISLFVPGKPQSAGSKRAFVVNRKRDGKPVAVVTEDNKRSKDWRGDIKRFAADAYSGPMLGGPLSITLVFYMDRPMFHSGKKGVRASAPTKPDVKPDVDKLSRAVLDALTGVLYRDDAQITSKWARKRYARGPMQTPGVLIEIGPDTDP